MAGFDGRSVNGSKSCPNLCNIRDQLYGSYTVCKECGSTSLSETKDTDGTVLLINCKDCHHVYGMDDSFTPNDVQDLYRQHRLSTFVLCCGNRDPDKYIIVDVNESGWIVQCDICQEISAIDGDLTLEVTDSENTIANQKNQETNPSKSNSNIYEMNKKSGVNVLTNNFCDRRNDRELICDCGNSDNKNFSVHIEDGKVKTACCNECGNIFNPNDSAIIKKKKVPTDHLANFISCKCMESSVVVTEVEQMEIIECTKCNKYAYIPHEEKRSKLRCRSSLPETKKLFNSSNQNQPNYDFAEDACNKANGSSRESSKIRKDIIVNDIKDVSRGDHIFWKRKEGYFHHAIAENWNENNRRISVIHYNGPSPRGDTVKGKIICEDVSAFDSGSLFIRKYDECDDPDTVIQRAYSRLGEVNYSLLLNNCEHFASWCKTGKSVCDQVNVVKNALYRHAKTQGQHCIKQATHLLANKTTKMLGKTTNAADDVMSLTAKGAKGSKVMSRIGVSTMIACEAMKLSNDIKAAKDKRNKGEIDNKEMARIIVRSTSAGIGSVAGSTVGSFLGQIAIPIPILGSFVGGTVGGLLGEGIGWTTGSVAAVAIAKKKKVPTATLR